MRLWSPDVVCVVLGWIDHETIKILDLPEGLDKPGEYSSTFSYKEDEEGEIDPILKVNASEQLSSILTQHTELYESRPN